MCKNMLNQKKSLRLKKKNCIFKKLIEREKNDYYDYSIDEDYTMNNSEASIVGENEKTRGGGEIRGENCMAGERLHR